MILRGSSRECTKGILIYVFVAILWGDIDPRGRGAKTEETNIFGPRVAMAPHKIAKNLDIKIPSVFLLELPLRIIHDNV